ncbi:MAG: hypothetical protein EHM30_08240 [Desulfobacteraceae bacterium]|nr:MAG: hypothetical protein EHM30_08240 [Desulfobacteraceae bacterium]
MKCPACRSENFYLKDPEDEYEIHPFRIKDGVVCFDPDTDILNAPAVSSDTETFCNQCAWHGKFNALDNQ